MRWLVKSVPDGLTYVIDDDERISDPLTYQEEREIRSNPSLLYEYAVGDYAPFEMRFRVLMGA